MGHHSHRRAKTSEDDAWSPEITNLYVQNALGAELGYSNQGPPLSSSSFFSFIPIITNIYAYCISQDRLDYALVTNKSYDTSGLI